MTDPRLERPTWRDRTNVDAYTIAWILRAEAIVRERWPQLAHELVITKGGYQPAADDDSADTHTRGGATDFTWCHPQCLLALRLAGGFIWHRVKTAAWNDHMHGAPIGHPDMAPGLARQETAYFNRRDGLANNGPDNGPRLDPIPRPIWPWPPTEENEVISKEDRAAIVKDLLDAPIAGDGRTVRQALRQASKAAGLADQVANRSAELLDEIGAIGEGRTGPTFDEVKDAVKQALREGTGTGTGD